MKPKQEGLLKEKIKEENRENQLSKKIIKTLAKLTTTTTKDKEKTQNTSGLKQRTSVQILQQF